MSYIPFPQPLSASSGQFLSWNGTSWVTTSGSTSAAGSGISSINGLTALTQTIVVGANGVVPNISSSGLQHTINIPSGSSTTNGVISSGDWVVFNTKLGPSATGGFEVQGNKGVVGGYSSLNNAGLVPTGQLGTNTNNVNGYLRGDSTWATGILTVNDYKVHYGTGITVANTANNITFVSFTIPSGKLSVGRSANITVPMLLINNSATNRTFNLGVLYGGQPFIRDATANISAGSVARSCAFRFLINNINGSGHHIYCEFTLGGNAATSSGYGDLAIAAIPYTIAGTGGPVNPSSNNVFEAYIGLSFATGSLSYTTYPPRLELL